MLEFKKEIINGSFNKISKTGKCTDFININIKAKDKNIDVKIAGKGLLIAGFVSVAPTAICVLSTTIAVCAITKQIYNRRKAKEEISNNKI
jgi:hypothetical protein